MKLEDHGRKVDNWLGAGALGRQLLARRCSDTTRRERSAESAMTCAPMSGRAINAASYAATTTTGDKTTVPSESTSAR